MEITKKLIKEFIDRESKECEKHGVASGTIFRDIIRAIDDRTKELCLSIDDFNINKSLDKK
jgi:hypothetical protein